MKHLFVLKNENGKENARYKKPVKSEMSGGREVKDFQMQSKVIPMVAWFAWREGGRHVLVIPFPITR